MVSRAERLLELMQCLRRHQEVVAGAVLARELGISLRSLYRDIASLRAQGAKIEGEAGVGYVLRPGFLLPPLMFSAEEIEALVLGSRWVARHGDQALGAAAGNALAKISAVLPPDARLEMESSALMVGPGEPTRDAAGMLPRLRAAIRLERKLDIAYQDLKGEPSRRVIWPFGLGFFEQSRVVVAWCELRQGYRHFRADRIRDMEESATRYPRRRQALLKEWKRLQQGDA